MRSLLTSIAIASLGFGVCACGGSSGDAASQGASGATGGIPVQTSYTSTVNNDRDNDGDHNNDDQHVLAFGHVAGAAEGREIAELVKRYYAAAAVGDGAHACALLAPFIAESVAEDYGHAQGLLGKSCSVVMSKMFGQHHRELVGKNASLKVTRVGIEGDKSLVALEFPNIPEARQITARHTGNSWWMLTLLDDNIE